MIKKVIVTNYVGDTLELELANPYKTGFAISNIDGIASLEANVNTTDVATNDGAIFNSARTGTRNIVFEFIFADGYGKSIEEIRLDLYKYFPVKKKINLEFVTDNRNVSIDGYVEKSETEIFSKMESAQVSIICPDPYFEDALKDVYDFSGHDAMFEFPFEGDLETRPSIIFSEIYRSTIRTIKYTGDVETGMTIHISSSGNASNITLYNMDTGERMSINEDLQAGDEIIINTTRNKKSAKLLRNGVYKNILNKLGRGSDWFELQKGDNKIIFMATTGQDFLELSIDTKVLYEGI